MILFILVGYWETFLRGRNWWMLCRGKIVVWIRIFGVEFIGIEFEELNWGVRNRGTIKRRGVEENKGWYFM